MRGARHLRRTFDHFVNDRLTITFRSSPRTRVHRLGDHHIRLRQTLDGRRGSGRRRHVRFRRTGRNIATLGHVLPHLGLLTSSDLTSHISRVHRHLSRTRRTTHFIRRFNGRLTGLRPVISMLRDSPRRFRRLGRSCTCSRRVRHSTHRRTFTLARIIRHHTRFDCSSSTRVLDNGDSLGRGLHRHLRRTRTRHAHTHRTLHNRTTRLDRCGRILTSLGDSCSAGGRLLGSLRHRLRSVNIHTSDKTRRQTHVHHSRLRTRLDGGHSHHGRLRGTLAFYRTRVSGLAHGLHGLRQSCFRVHRRMIATGTN